MPLPRYAKDLIYALPFILLFGLIYLLYDQGLVSDVMAVTLSLLLLIVALVAGFLRYSSLKSVSLVILVCIPFFVFLFALVYAELGIISSSGAPVSEMDYLYFSIVTFTTLGYGDFQPTEAARLFAAVEALLGYVILGVFVSVLIIMNQRRSEALEKARGEERKQRARTQSVPATDPLEVKMFREK